MSVSIWRNAEIRLVDPRELLVDENSRTIRDIAAEEPELVASVRRHGVVVPVIANPVDGDRLRVRDGHSRTLSALLAVDEHPVIPVLVTESTDEQQWRRLCDQWIANEIRNGFSAGDKARLLEQMTLFGLSPEEVAAELTTDVETVRAGLAVARSSRATQAVDTHPELDLMQAAALAEFEDDSEASATLGRVLEERPEQYDHQVALLRRTRAAAQRRMAKAEELQAAGVTVLDEADTAGAVAVTKLLRAPDGKTAHTVKAHASCPGHAAVVSTGYTGDVFVEYVCRDWKANGHGLVAAPGRGGERTEAEKAEMRRVRANNEAWRAAMSVRRKFLRELLGRKTMPGQLAFHLLVAVVNGGAHLTSALSKGSDRAIALLGLKTPRRYGEPHPISTKAKRASRDQVLVLLAAVVLGGMESAYDLQHSVNTWRSPTQEDKVYFGILRELGYTLSTVESLVLDPAADADQWEHLSVDAAKDKAAGKPSNADAA